MLQPRTLSRENSLNSLATALNQLALCSRHASKSRQPQLIFARHASHAAQGRANGPKDSAGRRLGAKKTASQYVIPGNIIFKQRGTKWFPGENVGLGKDHTIWSKVYGYVRYYRNPAIHPKRRYIGVALEKDGPGSQLPTPHNAPTRRRLGMYAAPIPIPTPTPVPASAQPETEFLQTQATTSTGPNTIFATPMAAPASSAKTVAQGLKPFDPANTTRKGGFGISNYEIGQAAERKGVRVKEFDRKDRWTAWRVRAKKVKEKRIAKAAKQTKKTKGRKASKKVVV